MKVSVSVGFLSVQFLVLSCLPVLGFEDPLPVNSLRTRVSSPLTLRGCVLVKAGRFLLVDTATAAVTELRGKGLRENVGDRATVKGATAAAVPSFRDVALVIDVDAITSVSPGGCLTVAWSLGAEVTVPSAPAPEAPLAVNTPSIAQRVKAVLMTPVQHVR